MAEPDRLVAVKTRPSWEKALSFMSAVGSVVTHGGLTDEATYKTRLESCHACPEIDRSPDGQEYCGACDCGRWPVARLDRKLSFPGLECPLGRAGFANAGKIAEGEVIEMQKCAGCSKPEPDRSLIPVGSRVVIATKLPGEDFDPRPWIVEDARGVRDGHPDVYDIKRPRRWFTWGWFKNRFRPERATISRLAIARAPGTFTL